MTRILVPALAILLALGAYLLFGRSGGSDAGKDAAKEVPASVPGGANRVGPTQSQAPKGATDRVPVAPIRMRSGRSENGNAVAPVASEVSLAEGFEAEELDSVFSATHSELVRGVVEELAESGTGTARIEELECRSQHCKLRLASGNAEGLVKLVDALQDERGFLGKAESLMLSRQEDDIIFYLRFPRPK